jgi:cytochrome b involved in lipid metabolism
LEEWVRYAKEHHRYVIFYEECVMDVTEFIHSHPGGKKALINYIYKDVTATLFKVYKHDRQNTLATLKKYIIGRLTPRDRSKGDSHKQPSNSKPKKRVCFQDRCEEKQSSVKIKRGEQKSKTAFEPSPRQ